MNTKPSTSLCLRPALKEWAIAVNALTLGEMILLLRKGGIREQGGLFRVAHDQVWLYPTYEHQKPQLLKPEYANQVQPVPSGWHPTTVELRAWAEVTEVMQVSEAEAIAALLPLHIWTPEFVMERLNWKPRQPVYVLLLRVYRLETPQSIPYQPEYGGCKSWIELAEPLSVARSHPVLDDGAYARQVEQIRQKLNHSPQSADGETI